eukprot:gnl/TRDRNA2_/TRDRNA2_146569_c0_seq1.p1 gnl/TRDRNA2_/TRDRNA2_146569_c0~~gnl/TRDRNA2_/TRDRNA2_146569_c0_seq1.p1  ORF type:complete len:129 (+),score=24.11 gnl/TRDRNA2_/TRDRNA2_146569_c0_seq1:141-527(+)
MAWVFAMSSEPAPDLLEPTTALRAMESHGMAPQVLGYQMIMECLAVSGQIVAGFALLARVEARQLQSDLDENCYPMLRSLLEVCRSAGHSDGASEMQAILLRFAGHGSTAIAPVARTLARRRAAVHLD